MEGFNRREGKEEGRKEGGVGEGRKKEKSVAGRGKIVRFRRQPDQFKTSSTGWLKSIIDSVAAWLSPY